MTQVLLKQEKKIGNYLSPDITLGQVWTASNIANYMVKLVKKYNTINVNKILDPAVGPATFIESLFFANHYNDATFFCFDIDERMINYTDGYCKNQSLKTFSFCVDYLLSDISKFDKMDLIIMNPPYIRHEKLESTKKVAYQSNIKTLYGEVIDGRSNLYSYFLPLSSLLFYLHPL